MTSENWVNVRLWEFLRGQSEGQPNYFQWLGGWQKVYLSILSFHYHRLDSLSAQPIRIQCSQHGQSGHLKWPWPGKPTLPLLPVLCTQRNPWLSFCSLFYKIALKVASFYYKYNACLFNKAIQCRIMYSSSIFFLGPPTPITFVLVVGWFFFQAYIYALLHCYFYALSLHKHGIIVLYFNHHFPLNPVSWTLATGTNISTWFVLLNNCIRLHYLIPFWWELWRITGKKWALTFHSNVSPQIGTSKGCKAK